MKMPSHTTRSSTDAEEDEMPLNSDSRRLSSMPGSLYRSRHISNLATIVRDSTNWVPMIRYLQETDVIILLTPVVIPISQDPTDISDPFEPLGRSLARRHPRIRHVPYTQRNGITSTHLGFIKRGQVTILCFVLPEPGQQIQLDFADIALAVSGNKPCIIIVCCSPMDDSSGIPFPTVIHSTGYSSESLEATASLLFSENLPSAPEVGVTGVDTSRSKVWEVEPWNEVRDISSVWDLWVRNISPRFAIDQQSLASLLRRPGYAKHYVVRNSRSREVIGFCATYLSYVDQEGEKLIASLAVLIVKSTNRQRGVGLSLHNHAIEQLKKTRGVVRLQLGSNFPRLLYGPPSGIPVHEDWFRRRGWHLHEHAPGHGQAVYDLIINLKDWRRVQPSKSTLPQFRACVQEDMVKVLALVEQTCIRQARMGWYDQYSALMNGPNVKDIVLGIEQGSIIAAALTYTPSGGSPVAVNLPWAGLNGNDVGGVTCICIFPPRDDNTITGLLDACVKSLDKQGMRRMFLDGITNELSDFKRLGFSEWARYKNIWRDA